MPAPRPPLAPPPRALPLLSAGFVIALVLLVLGSYIEALCQGDSRHSCPSRVSAFGELGATP